MSHSSAYRYARDPLTWLLEYWLAVGSVGVLRGEDRVLMRLRMEMEHEQIDPSLLDRFRSAWYQYRRANEQASNQHWAQMTVQSEEAKWYSRDIDRMLEDKIQKGRVYLGRMENKLLLALRYTRFDEAKVLFQGLVTVYTKLKEEAARDTEARNQPSIDANGVPNEGGQGTDEMEASEGEIWD